MDWEALHAAKAQMVAQMQAGQSWHDAATNAGLQTSRATAYRLLHRVRTEGAVALDDQRHGYPAKMRQPVRDWLITFCRAAPASTGHTVQAALLERFGLTVSVSQTGSHATVPVRMKNAKRMEGITVMRCRAGIVSLSRSAQKRFWHALAHYLFCIQACSCCWTRRPSSCCPRGTGISIFLWLLANVGQVRTNTLCRSSTCLRFAKEVVPSGR